MHSLSNKSERPHLTPHVFSTIFWDKIISNTKYPNAYDINRNSLSMPTIGKNKPGIYLGARQSRGLPSLKTIFING